LITPAYQNSATAIRPKTPLLRFVAQQIQINNKAEEARGRKGRKGEGWKGKQGRG